MNQALLGGSDWVVRLVRPPGPEPVTVSELEGLFRRGAQ